MKNPLHSTFTKLILLTLTILTAISCQSKYEKMESRELKSGKIANEIFLGLELGMSQKAFYEICWDLNKKGILSNGPSELSVEYTVEMPSELTAKMRFYPKFEEKKITQMQVEFSYEGWAIWNENLAVEKLREDVVKLFEKWYGPEFIEVSNADKSQIVFVKVDGNRRIRVFKKQISIVRAEIVDLNNLRKQEENPA